MTTRPPHAAPCPYRGSEKHKNRPKGEVKGTLCPEWTHEAAGRRLGNDVFDHPWRHTRAFVLFLEAEPPDDPDRRFATADGIAFEAKPTLDGSWHGYPVPWAAVPPAILDRWLADGRVTRRQLKKQAGLDTDNIRWALASNSNE